MDKYQALGIALRNLKGPRDKDILRTAEAIEIVRNEFGAGSRKAAAARLSVSRPIIDDFLGIRALPEDIQDAYRTGRLRTLEQGKSLRRLQRARGNDIAAAAAAMERLTAHEARDLVNYLVKHPDVSVEQALGTLETAKTKRTKLFVVLVDLDEPVFARLRKHAARRKVGIPEAAADLIGSALGNVRPPSP